MRIVWRDSAVSRKDFQYRGVWIRGHKDGWIISLPGDNNIYKTGFCCKNAIDLALGLEGTKNYKNGVPRREKGIQIIGKKDDKKLG